MTIYIIQQRARLYRQLSNMNEFRRAEKKAFAVGLTIALSVDVIMNVLHFVGLV